YRFFEDALPSRPRQALRGDQIVERFEGHLRAMAREARKAGVPLVLATLPVNKRDYPPMASQAEGAMPWFKKARGLDRQGRKAEALEAYDMALSMDYPDRCWPAKNDAIRRVAKEEGAT